MRTQGHGAAGAELVSQISLRNSSAATIYFHIVKFYAFVSLVACTKVQNLCFFSPLVKRFSAMNYASHKAFLSNIRLITTRA